MNMAMVADPVRRKVPVVRQGWGSRQTLAAGRRARPSGVRRAPWATAGCSTRVGTQGCRTEVAGQRCWPPRSGSTRGGPPRVGMPDCLVDASPPAPECAERYALLPRRARKWAPGRPRGSAIGCAAAPSAAAAACGGTPCKRTPNTLAHHRRNGATKWFLRGRGGRRGHECPHDAPD